MDPEELADELRQLGAYLGEGDADEVVAVSAAAALEADRAGSHAESPLPILHGIVPIVGEGLCDHLSIWPVPFPAALAYKEGQSRDRIPQSKPVDFLTLAVYSIALTLSARFNATTRAVNYVLQCLILLMNHCLAVSSSSARPVSSPIESTPGMQSAHTLRTALVHLAVQDEVYVHPTCANPEGD
ncbi:MAG: hypothetical protein TREMPRED_004394 [Tremellales sp. Tagirdzhanova-0007]|nr:MAG: hypothetical protein TREMPRED_004394 [Tremellales sp. Tagirdzhanova-0007]